MIEDLIARTGVSGRGRLLDLACGTGQLAFPLRRSFAEVWAVDREPDFAQMVQAKAGKLGAGNIRPVTADAETLDAEPGHFELAVMAAPSTGSTATWSPPGCCTGCGPAGAWRCAGRTSRNWVTGSGSGRSRRCSTGGRQRSARPAGSPQLGRAAAATARCPGAVRGRVRDGQAPRVPRRAPVSLAELAGYVRFTSFLPPSVLGDQGAAFDDDLAAAIGRSARRHLPHDVGFVYDLARKPTD